MSRNSSEACLPASNVLSEPKANIIGKKQITAEQRKEELKDIELQQDKLSVRVTKVHSICDDLLRTNRTESRSLLQFFLEQQTKEYKSDSEYINYVCKVFLPTLFGALYLEYNRVVFGLIYTTDEDIENEKLDLSFDPVKVSANRFQKKTLCYTKGLMDRIKLLGTSKDTELVDIRSTPLDNQCHDIRKKARKIESTIEGYICFSNYVSFIPNNNVGNFLTSAGYITKNKKKVVHSWTFEEDAHTTSINSGLSVLEDMLKQLSDIATKNGCIIPMDLINLTTEESSGKVLAGRSKSKKSKSKSSAGQKVLVAGQKGTVDDPMIVIDEESNTNPGHILEIESKLMTEKINKISLSISPAAAAEGEQIIVPYNSITMEDNQEKTHRLIVASSSAEGEEEKEGTEIEATETAKEIKWVIEGEQEAMPQNHLVIELSLAPKEQLLQLEKFIEPIVDKNSIKIPTKIPNEQLLEILQMTPYGMKFFKDCNTSDELMGAWLTQAVNHMEEGITKNARFGSITHTFLYILFKLHRTFLQAFLADAVQTVNTIGKLAIIMLQLMNFDQ
jgi:hypothetical protein